MRTLITQPELPGDEDDVVRVMSLHKAKGLTAKVVIVAGCVEGAMPFIDFEASQDEQARSMEEQRRLFYVAVTRASETLVLSSAVKMSFRDARNMHIRIARRSHGTAFVNASRFLAELGPDRPETITASAWRGRLNF